MPINGVLDLQRRSLQIGEIRIGTSVQGARGKQPKRLDTFRFTVGSESTAQAVADLYGGHVAPWSERKGMFEVITDRTELQVWVPPRGEAVDSWMEAWDGAKCLAKCDGIMMVRPRRQPCMCPQPDDPADPGSVEDARNERIRLAGMRPPQACKPRTRIHVSITELPGALGVFKLNTGSEGTAVESGDQGDTLALARERGVYLPAILRISWRTRVGDGKPYPVPVLQIGSSLQQIANGELPAGPAGLLAALAPAAPERLALDSAPAAAGPLALEAASPAQLDPAEAERRQCAQGIYARALAARSRTQVERCFTDATDGAVSDEPVCINQAADEWQSLHEALQDAWKAAAA